MTAPSYRIVINGKLFTVELPVLASVQIRALAGLPPDQTLLVEGVGAAADRLLGDEDSVSLKEGPVHIYGLPPTVMG